jgi:hypothetical protein
VKLPRRWPELVAAAFGVLVFLSRGGAIALSPTHVSWLRPGSDWGFHFTGWEFFRHAPWGWPLGAIPGLLWPVGTTIGYMDGLPWLAFVLKLASPVLPDPIQYIGLWLCACYALQGWFGARLVAALSPSRIAAVFGGGLFVLAPVLLHRLVHEALCAHFLLLAAIALAVRRETRAPLWAPILLPAFTMGIHPYLAFMVLAVCLAAIARHAWAGLLGLRAALLRAALTCVAAIGVAALLGYFVHGSGDIGGRGFGKWCSDLTSLISPDGHSRLLPNLPMLFWEGEGCGFVGLGVLALGVSAFALQLLAWRRHEPALPWRRVVPLIVAALLCALLAYASKIKLLGKEILDVAFLYPDAVGAAFRSSGRFIWVLTYTLTAGALAVWLARRPRLAPYVIAGAFVLQAADTKGVFIADKFGPARTPTRFAPEWQLAAGEYEHLELYPPRCGDGGGVCCEGFTPPPPPGDMYLALLATHLGLTYNGYGAARVPRVEHGRYCQRLKEDVAAGRLDPRSLYLVAREQEKPFLAGNPAAPCKRVESGLLCVSAQAMGKLRDWLGTAPAPPAPQR